MDHSLRFPYLTVPANGTVIALKHWKAAFVVLCILFNILSTASS